MNVADSQLLASELERMGYSAADDPDQADILVVNTCVVRQSAEDKAFGRLALLNELKKDQPDKVIGVMGCLVGVRDPLALRKRLPYVDVFMPPSEPTPMVEFLRSRMDEAEILELEARQREQRDLIQDGDLILPIQEQGSLISAHVPVVYGCSHACTFCIIPFRRGVERSRSVGEIVAHVRSLARQGVKEVTLLGQIVDRYGKDIPDGPDLADLLRIVHQTAEETGIERIRFLTSHPNWMTDRLLDTVAELPRVMPHIEVPVQAGDDEVLERMKRGYTVEQYRRLIERIRARIPGVAIHTDIIVGFCGETDAQFQRTTDLLAELKLDKVHLARYSPRPNTVSDRRMEDDVPEEEKKRRLRPAGPTAGAGGRGDQQPLAGADRPGAGRRSAQRQVARADAPRQDRVLRGHGGLARQSGERRDHVDGSMEYVGAASGVAAGRAAAGRDRRVIRALSSGGQSF